jgi:hypothetical protein
MVENCFQDTYSQFINVFPYSLLKMKSQFEYYSLLEIIIILK